MEEEKIIKIEGTLDRIFYPKYAKKVDSGEFAIFRVFITKRLENCEDEIEDIKVKGNVCTLEYGTTYKIFAKLTETHEIYGNTYDLVYISKCIDISSKDKQKEFLKNVLNENLVDKLFDEYDDVIKLLEERDVKSLMKIKGIGNQVALKMIDEYEESKDYSAIYMELGQLGLTHTFIKKLVDFYHSPDTVIDVVRNNPYDLVRVDGVGFKKADEVACKVGIGQYDICRIKGFLLHHLNEQGEAGKSYLNYQELMKALYDTLGFVPEEVINATAKQMIENEDVVVLDNGSKIALKRFYDLEKNIMNELLRLQIGKIKIIENNSENGDESELHSDYIPKSFNIGNWETVVKRVEEKQGFTFTEEQRSAIKLSLDNHVITITGSAGCVDCDTEYFNGNEWKCISDYSKDDKVLQYNKDGTAELVKPLRFIKQPKEYLWHFETMYGLDQCLSENHNCILVSAKNNLHEEKFESIMQRQNNLKFHDKFITAFHYGGRGIDISDDMLRLMIAASADASYDYNADETWNTYNRARFRIKKARKISRLINIIKSLSLEYDIKTFENDDHVNIYVYLPYRIKEFPLEWYNCSKHQFEIIAEEIMYWDGDYVNRNRYSTSIKTNADFVQFVFSALGKRASILENDRRGRIQTVNDKEYVTKSVEYTVSISDRVNVGLCCDKRNNYNPTQFEKYKTKDGYEYCFTVPSHMLVLRRNNKIFITGNCGKTSTANGICSLYDDYNILACALSGKASVRITEATGLPASTIHRALGYQNGKFMFNKDNKLAVDIVLIDEATMINGTLFLSLLEAIPTGAKVIIMGDVQQLTPIGNCQVFADILDSNVLPVVKLTKPHRQALMSGIIPTSIKVANQEQIFANSFEGNEILGELKDMELDITGNKESRTDSIISHFQAEMDKYHDIIEVQVCVPMRLKGELSCYNLNTKIQDIYNPKFVDGNEIEILLEKKSEDVKKYHIRVGDKVLNTKNNYKCTNTDGDITPVFNGNIGIVKEIEDNGYCTIDFVGIGEVIFSKTDSKNLELAYACTIHKCITEDTWLYTSNGLMQLKEFNNNANERESRKLNTNIKVFNGQYMEKPNNFYNAGISRCKKITTQRGYSITATEDHRLDVLCEDGLIKCKYLSEISDKDYLIIQRRADIYGDVVKLPPHMCVDENKLDIRVIKYKSPKYLTNEFARFLGYMTADGVICKAGLKYGKNHKNVVIDFENTVYQVFGYKTSHDPKNVLPNGKMGGMFLSEINSVFIREFCIKIDGIQPNNKFVPRCILSAPKQYQIEFLRGLFEDGTVCIKNGKFDHISFTAKEELLINQIQMMLLNIGIVTTKYHRIQKGFSSFTLFIYGKNCDRYIKNIGFISNEKADKSFKFYEKEYSDNDNYTIPYITKIIRNIINDNDWKISHIDPKLSSICSSGKITYMMLGRFLDYCKMQVFNDSRVEYLNDIYNNTDIEKISTIEEIKKHTYCIEMPISHKFIQNGIRGWNCQGSGFTSTIVGMDTGSYIMNNSELLYTAITRAKKYCVLVGNNYAISKAIQTKEVKTKQTFLRDMLLENSYRLKEVV